MVEINLRHFYPWYMKDCLVEVSDEVAAEFRANRLYEAAHQRRTGRNKAAYSLDMEDGIEYQQNRQTVALSCGSFYQNRYLRYAKASTSKRNQANLEIARLLYRSKEITAILPAQNYRAPPATSTGTHADESCVCRKWHHPTSASPRAQARSDRWRMCSTAARSTAKSFDC